MKDITISNFRCYESASFDFRPGINLLIGDNASGKTSLIRACNLVVNSFFCGFSDENTKWKSADNEDFRSVVGGDGVILPEQPVSILFHLGQSDLHPVRRKDGSVVEFDYSQDLRIEKKSKKNSRNLLTGLMPLRDYGALLNAMSHQPTEAGVKQLNPLPVYACFTTEDIHASRKIGIDKSKFLEYAQKPSFGYYECYDCRGLFGYWQQRLLVLQEAEETGTVEINAVRKAVKEALSANGCNIIDDILVRPMRGKVFFKYTDGRVVEAAMLSDGYKRLVNIVIEIAVRCALLNKVIYGEDCCKMTHGTVIVDEIDEHLHPELQGKVLRSLHNAFPKIQFIVSTHAPLVISSVEESEENVVYRLWYDHDTGEYKHVELNTYGWDANLTLEEGMMVNSRDSRVKEAIDSVCKSVSERNLPEAKLRLAELEAMTSPDQPAIVRIRAIINRLESRRHEIH